jgi:hypothetical protein
MSRLLINEPPLQVLPSLAKEIGLNEAIMLQQMHYWLLKSVNEFEGVKWFYKTLEEWQTEFPFWSAMTIRRTLGSLEKQKIIKIGNFNKKKFDKTKWYTIDYQRVNRRCVQNEQTMCADCTDGCVQNEQTNTRDYQESTTENTNVSEEKPPKVVWTDETKHIIDYLNKRTGKKYSVKTKKTAQLVHNLLDNGFTVEDFERVIDIKCSQWLNNEKMNQYLRPRTLFSEKFEDYLNEAPARLNQQGASGQSVADKMKELFGSDWQG